MAEGEALRQQLEAAAQTETDRHGVDYERGGCRCGFCAYSIEHVVIMSVREAARRTVPAALAAARVATATEIAEAIEARDVGYAEDGYDQGWNDAMRTAAGEARVAGGSVPAPKGDQ